LYLLHSTNATLDWIGLGAFQAEKPEAARFSHPSDEEKFSGIFEEDNIFGM